MCPAMRNLWGRTASVAAQSPVKLDFSRCQKFYRTYGCNASEINGSATPRKKVYPFAGAHSWLDVATSVLLRIDWRPECDSVRLLNIPKVIPPRSFPHLLFAGGRFSLADKSYVRGGVRLLRLRVELFYAAKTPWRICGDKI